MPITMETVSDRPMREMPCAYATAARPQPRPQAKGTASLRKGTSANKRGQPGNAAHATASGITDEREHIGAEERVLVGVAALHAQRESEDAACHAREAHQDHAEDLRVHSLKAKAPHCRGAFVLRVKPEIGPMRPSA